MVSDQRLQNMKMPLLNEGQLMHIVTPLHNREKRSYGARMRADKIQSMIKAREFEFDYWDGDRRHGYGGYRYDGRWKSVAEQLIDFYQLKEDAKILDVGCGKAHLLYELMRLLPKAHLKGIDISRYALKEAPVEIRNCLMFHRAQDPYPWEDHYFDLVISLGCLHNLKIFDLAAALKEIERMGNRKYIVVESYRNEVELYNLQCWALTAEAFFDPSEWIWIFRYFGYTGDYEFIYFE